MFLYLQGGQFCGVTVLDVIQLPLQWVICDTYWRQSCFPLHLMMLMSSFYTVVLVILARGIAGERCCTHRILNWNLQKNWKVVALFRILDSKISKTCIKPNRGRVSNFFKAFYEKDLTGNSINVECPLTSFLVLTSLTMVGWSSFILSLISKEQSANWHLCASPFLLCLCGPVCDKVHLKMCFKITAQISA